MCWGFYVYVLLFKMGGGKKMGIETALGMCIILCLFRVLLGILGVFFPYFLQKKYTLTLQNGNVYTKKCILI